MDCRDWVFSLLECKGEGDPWLTLIDSSVMSIEESDPESSSSIYAISASQIVSLKLLWKFY